MDTQATTPQKPEPLPGLMAAKEICAAVNISRAHLYALTAANKFPAPALRIGTRFTRWSTEAVREWARDPQTWISAHASDPHGIAA